MGAARQSPHTGEWSPSPASRCLYSRLRILAATFAMAETELKNQESQAQNGKSPEASPEKNKEASGDCKARAMMCLVSGKRHLLVQDIAAATESLGEACELVVQEYGDKAPECAEAYFYYGKALLEAARLEAGVLGNIDTDESEEKSDEDDEYGDYQDGDEKEETEESAEGEGEADKAETKEGASKVDAEPEK